MKIRFLASSILWVLAFVLLTGCQDLGIRDYFADDQVPADIKAQPRLVATPPPETADATGWPRLGDVPFKPNDFSPKVVYNHYMNELEFHRDEAVVDKKEAASEDPLLEADLLPTPEGKKSAPSTSSASASLGLLPPQLPRD